MFCIKPPWMSFHWMWSRLQHLSCIYLLYFSFSDVCSQRWFMCLIFQNWAPMNICFSERFFQRSHYTIWRKKNPTKKQVNSRGFWTECWTKGYHSLLSQTPEWNAICEIFQSTSFCLVKSRQWFLNPFKTQLNKSHTHNWPFFPHKHLNCQKVREFLIDT